MTKFYVDQAGVFLGGFDGALPPAGAVEVPSAPDHALDVWNGATWDKYADTPAGQAEALEAAMAPTDAGLVRVLEDLVDALEAKGVLALADLPVGAQEKILARRAMRGG